MTVLVFLSCCSKGTRSEDETQAPAHLSSAAVRAPVVSGSFYPSDPQELRTLVHSLLQSVREDPARTILHDPVEMILVPHAGYLFSGRTQAYAYAEIAGSHYDTVVLLGSPHRVLVNGASIYCGKGFRMPWGTVPVDRELSEALVKSSDLINGEQLPHLPEHSLEVQLPFLSAAVGNFAIVPILVMGDVKTLDTVAAAIFHEVGKISIKKKLLYVISSDLSHFPKKQDALRCDGEMMDAFLSLDAARLLRTEKEIMKRGVPNLACAMCGIDAAYVGLKIAAAIGIRKAVLLHRSVSSDAGIEGVSEERVVGYAAVALLSASPSTGFDFPLKRDERIFVELPKNFQ